MTIDRGIMSGKRISSLGLASDTVFKLVFDDVSAFINDNELFNHYEQCYQFLLEREGNSDTNFEFEDLKERERRSVGLLMVPPPPSHQFDAFSTKNRLFKA